MTRPPIFTDADILAALTGAGDPARAEALWAAMAEDEALEARVRALDVPPVGLLEAFGMLERAAGQVPAAALTNRSPEAPAETPRPTTAPPLKPTPRPEAAARPAPRFGRRQLFEGAIAAGIGGVAFGLGYASRPGPASAPPIAVPGPDPTPGPPPVPPPARPAWLDAVASYVRLYTGDTFKLAPPPQAIREASLQALADRLEIDLAPIAAPEGLRLQAAQLLQLGERPLGQVAYLDEQDRPLAVCILQRPAPPPDAPPVPAAPPSFAFDEVQGVGIVHWSVGRFGFLVAGRLAEADLRAIAADVAARLA